MTAAGVERHPIGSPWPGVGAGAAFVRAVRGWSTFHGRASRAEFWWWTFWSALVSAVLAGIASALVLPDLVGLVEAARSSMVDGTGSTLAVGYQDVPAGTATAETVLTVVSSVVGLAMLLPTVAVSVRRLHDTGRSGWWTVLWFVPFLQIVAWVLLADRSAPAGERFDA